jgi:hypothetical protein
VAPEQDRGYADDAQDKSNADSLSGKQKLAVATPFPVPKAHAKPVKLLG